MDITVTVDPAEWERALDVLLAASADQARQASLEGAEAIRDVAVALLGFQHHAPDTWTPSAPGEPPAMISGDLAGSMDARMMTPDEAWVGPTDSASSFNGPYGRIQEIGGLMEGRPLMRFYRGSRRFEYEEIFLPPRPYLGPATSDVTDSGRLTRIYEEHQLEAIMEATA